MKKIIQHFSNGRNVGDDWWFIIKMLLTGNILTDEKYQLYIDELLTRDSGGYLSVEETNAFLREIGVIDAD